MEMAAKRVMSLAESAWTVRAPRAESIVFPPGGEPGGRPAHGAYNEGEFRAALARGVKARVPGCVHQALIEAVLIESPDRGDAEEFLQWIGQAEWEYRCEFEWNGDAISPFEELELVIDGLDTVAEVFVNDNSVGKALSFFVPWRYDIRDSIRTGRNELVVRFTPPLVHIRAEEKRLGARPFNGDEIEVTAPRGGWEPFTFIRKPACNFGWDWGPKVATVGIAGGVWIERWSGARIRHVRPLVRSATADDAQLEVHVDVELRARFRSDTTGRSAPMASVDVDRLDVSASDNPVARGEAAPGAAGEEPHVVATLRAPGGGAIVAHARGAINPGEVAIALRLGITKPELWWPRGYGPQAADEERPLYDLHIELRDGDRVLDQWRRHVGLRTVELDTSSDRWGSAFTLRINGQPVFCMGANWIPEGLFAGYAAENMIRTRVRDAAEMNANMLRVWGGGLYEPECFYDECDRRGILVWQDFMFACGMYPEEAPFTGLVEREARHQVARLSSHASVVLWCGGNETIWGHDKWGWKERLKPGQSWGKGFWLDLLPRVCAELDPTRPYWPNSPWSGVDESGAQWDVLDPDHGNRHSWEVEAWKDGFRAPSVSGRGIIPRFCSEFGHQSTSDLKTLLEQFGDQGEAISAAFINELSRRQRGPGGDARWYEQCGLGSPPAAHDLAQWLSCAHEFQAQVIARGIEWHRINRPRCGGVLFWQLNDCWAGHSWSAIDAAGRRKSLWFAAQRAMSPRLLSIHIIDGSPALFAVNDTDEAWEGELVVRWQGEEAGSSNTESLKQARVGPRTAGRLADLSHLLALDAGATWQFIQAELGSETCVFPRHRVPDRPVH